MNNLKIMDSYTDKQDKVFYISRLNERMPWPSNSTLAMFVCDGEKVLKKYKVLEIGDENIKIVVIKN